MYIVLAFNKNVLICSNVKVCIELMVSWIHLYISEASFTKPDITHHGPFYSVCQAVFYVFAFKHTDLLAMSSGKW